MNELTKRSILRWIHIVFSIPILGYIYSPFDKIPNYAPATRLSSFLFSSLRDFACGKAMFFDDLQYFEKTGSHDNRAGNRGIRSNESVGTY